MTKILRNAILAAVAISAFAGSAFAQQSIVSCSDHDTYWGQCLGASNSGHDNHEGRGRAL
ncbi:hypothetical protein AB6802_08630 [Mesorhizobium sp. RCC_202]|uniref:hypothetical protein n=1 Tax=Mesorhizobium sp. RCC_202 TaxID=3239222 RepID=UPI0035234C09